MAFQDGLLEVEEFRAPRRSLRVAVVTETYPPEVNGVAMTVARVVRGLQARGHAVQLVRPRQQATAEQVQAVLRICHELQVPVVPRGAGTGLSGGALPLGNGVLLGLGKMKRILSIDPVARIARVQPAAYARTRNRLDGAVTGLSPYLTHGLVLVAVVRATEFLGHAPTLRACVVMVAAVLISLALAYVFYRVVERRCMSAETRAMFTPAEADRPRIPAHPARRAAAASARPHDADRGSRP
jgi:hypothetical protein